VRHPKDALQIGQNVTVTILGVDLDRHRISLGMAEEPQEAPSAEGGAPGTKRFGTFADLLKDKK
jgi:ribosomal protein S1